MKPITKKMLYGAAFSFSALGLAAGPVAAASPAAGVSRGEFNTYNYKDVSPLAPLPLCLVNTQVATLTLHNTGTLAGATNPTATVTIAVGALHFNPAGTFTDAACKVPGPVPATINVGSRCTGATGSAKYVRDGEAGLVEGPCGAYTMAFTGLQQPCFPDGPPPVDPCATPDTEWVGTYAQA